MRIWAHTLVKNEDKWLWFSVNSIINHVDKLLLWDTGSTDGSLEIENEIEKRYPGKIVLKRREILSPEDFTEVRQEMLEATKSDWLLMLDGDEIWWETSIRTLLSEIHKNGNNFESIVVPTVNLVGDIFHYQEKAAGKYRFGNRVGHYNLRAVKMGIPGLHSQGSHGVWGWADGEGKMIQDRNTFKFVDAPYLHATNLRRSAKDIGVIKRANKFKYELGEEFPKDYYYPEVFFWPKPAIVASPWPTMSLEYKLRAYFETPLRKIKRRIFKSKVGY
jgi:glycosyltransferase involved in cell wall biosynthesis